jgi:hypothetical protein
MKKPWICLLLILFAAFNSMSEEADVLIRAQQDAAEDGQTSRAVWWGVGGAAITVGPFLAVAFFGDAISVEARRVVALAAPVVGGTGLALVGFFTGKAEVPDSRITEIQNEYDDAGLLALYESEYQKTLTKIQRRKRGTAALMGFGIAAGATGLGFLVVYLTK